ncbi:CaiB/BaiF CoA-transferase family protein [Ottowia sp.]|uniref:CaiB/BaiF CoA transferase family protein n=1 Tax=Ottowia sp. TaxID=1898956 RepID=UPI0025DBFB25|nr:CaiB/BaiF CoA-transferase family protein [Ottowia sp.]MBK6746991.1 CoA transferase [Ottowia sp.]
MPALDGIRVVEFAGVGPGALAATLLADMGAKVLRIDRPTQHQLGAPKGAVQFNFLRRNRYEAALDLKAPTDMARVKELLASADALIEGFRPGVMEKIGLGPQECFSLNPALVYARVTGWGQDGPLSGRVGHDINFLARTGALDAIGQRGQPPAVPVTLVGDMGGGGMFTVAGILAALLEAGRSKRGQVVDVSVVDAVSNLAMSIHGRRASGDWQAERGTNYLDSGAPFYDVYRCADGRYVAVGAVERRFVDNLLGLLDIDFTAENDHFDRRHWPRLREEMASRFLQQSRDTWATLFATCECCAEPVLSFDEAVNDPQLVARRTFSDVAGVCQPSPAIRFSRTPCVPPRTPRAADGEATASQITNWLA